MSQRPLTIGIQPDRIGNESYSEKGAKAFTKLGHRTCFINLLSEESFSSLHQYDGIMWRWAHNPQDKQSAKRILFAIETYYHIPVFPNHLTAWHYNEKISQTYLFKALDIAVPQTWLFWEKNNALNWAHQAGYPVVFKLSSGAASANVILVQNVHHAVALVDKMFGPGMFPYTSNELKNRTMPQKGIKPFIHYLKAGFRYARFGEYPPLPEYWWRPEHGYAYFQEFLHGNHFDTRVTIIGKRAFAFRRKNRPGDFRASGSGSIDYDPAGIDPRCVENAFRISTAVGFQSMAYDFLEKDGQPVLVEISYTFADSAVKACPGFWTPSMSWVDGSMEPKTAQVEDFVEYIYAHQAGNAR